jgi:hypothetical protein
LGVLAVLDILTSLSILAILNVLTRLSILSSLSVLTRLSILPSSDLTLISRFSIPLLRLRVLTRQHPSRSILPTSRRSPIICIRISSA